ncbi:MAG: ComEA family DNA-binding protein [Oscillospiraceae bacterium]|nr:ComEA family DNA-binding protein [Oscillospiraceae bacterium]
MSKLSKFDCVVLVLAAVALMAMVGWFFVHQKDSQQTWSVEVERSDSPTPSVSVQEDKKPDSLMEGERININTASAEELVRLPGIGATRAQAIIDFRQERGAFSSVDELLRVDGIGPGILKDLRTYVTVE